MNQGCQHLLDHVQQAISASMLPGQTDLQIMTTLHLVTVFAQQTLLEESVRRDFSVPKDLMNPLPVLGDISVRVKGRLYSLHSVTLAGFVPVVLRSHSRLMGSLETSVQRESIVQVVPKFLSSARREHFQITLGTAMKTIVLPAPKDRTVKHKD